MVFHYGWGGKKTSIFFPIERVNSRLEIRRLLFLISNTPRPSIPVYKGKGFFKKQLGFEKRGAPFTIFYLSRCVVVSNPTMKKMDDGDPPHPTVYYSRVFMCEIYVNIF